MVTRGKMEIPREGYIAIFSLIVAILSLCIAVYALTYRIDGTMARSQERKMSYVTPDAPLVKEFAESLSSLENIRSFIEEKYVYVWEEIDTWERPQEMLEGYMTTGKLEGDCEDIAFLEVSLFRAIGVPENQVRVVIFSYPAGELRGIHAGVELWGNGDWRLLRLYDSMGVWTEQTLYPDEKMIEAFNDKIWWGE